MNKIKKALSFLEKYTASDKSSVNSILHNYFNKKSSYSYWDYVKTRPQLREED